VTSTETSPLPIDNEPLAVRDALPIAKRSRSTTRLTIALMVLLGVSAGFLVGVLLQKDSGSSSSNNPAGGDFAALAQQFGGSFPGGGANGAPTGNGAATDGATTGGGNGTTGQVKLIDGTNVYVTDSTGKTIKVATTADSKVAVAQASSLSALKVGDTVVVVGTAGSDGTVNATSITASADSGTPTS
jgi:hypothetical protein